LLLKQVKIWKARDGRGGARGQKAYDTGLKAGG
jgi:hypothetical protein